MRRPILARILPLALVAGLVGCNVTTTTSPTPRPLATGTLEQVKVWYKPVMRAGEIGENSAQSPPKGSRVEVFDQFILITPPGGSTILSPHGWYSELAFRRDPAP